MVTVLLYSRVYPPATGGMERFAADLAAWLADGRAEVTVVTGSPGPPGREFPVLRRPSPGATLRAARRADVVHVNGLSVRGIALATAALRPAVVTHQGHQLVCPTGLAWPGPDAPAPCTAGPPAGPCGVCPERSVRGHVKVRTHRLGAARAESVFVSRYLARRLGRPEGRVIHNPVAARAFAAARASGTDHGDVIAFAGRLVAEKGLDLLLGALPRLPGVRLDVAGDGPMRAAWEALAADLGVADRVRWLGALPFEGVADLYGRAAVVCVPSAWEEPFGYAAAEAMAMGRPLVVTPSGALPELAGDGRGWVADESTPQALGDALAAALADPAQRRLRGEVAREFARRELHIDTTGTRYLEAYAAAVSGRAVVGTVEPHP